MPYPKRQMIRMTPALLMVPMLATLASAHPGHGGSSFTSGLAHPTAGLDHVLAMMGVGLLAAGLKRRWLWALPLTFVLSMIVGAALGVGGWFAPSWVAEAGIAASVFAFGLLITLGAPLPPLIIAALTAAFALCHGSAHAAEMAPDASVAAYFGGFAVGTVCLHAVGVGLGLLMGRAAVPINAVRTCGVAIIACGTLMLVGVL